MSTTISKLPSGLTSLQILTHKYPENLFNPPTSDDERRAAQDLLAKEELSEEEQKALLLYTPVDILDKVLLKLKIITTVESKAIAA